MCAEREERLQPHKLLNRILLCSCGRKESASEHGSSEFQLWPRKRTRARRAMRKDAAARTQPARKSWKGSTWTAVCVCSTRNSYLMKWSIAAVHCTTHFSYFYERAAQREVEKQVIECGVKGRKKKTLRSGNWSLPSTQLVKIANGSKYY